MNEKPAGSWPVIAGSYQVGDPSAPVAVCALTSERLIAPMVEIPGVAIAGKVYTANLGITRIIVNITANPAIRFLLLCGKDSPVFRPGQSLAALAENGVDDSKKIIGAAGYEPVLTTLSPDKISMFRKQVEVIDWTGEEDVQSLRDRIASLAARSPGVFKTEAGLLEEPATGERFVPIRPGGQREPLVYDPKGYFVISLDREKGEIILRHYLPDHTPAHEMRGRGATSMLLGLVREGLVSQLSHAGYLGEELAKAQTALQFNLRYDQDRLLGSAEPSSQDETKEPTVAKAQAPTSMPSGTPGKTPTGVRLPMTLEELQASSPGQTVDLAMTIGQTEGLQSFRGYALASDEAEPFSIYHKTQREVTVEWSPATRMIMGVAGEVQTGGLVRVSGKLDKNLTVHAESIVILTHVARIT